MGRGRWYCGWYGLFAGHGCDARNRCSREKTGFPGVGVCVATKTGNLLRTLKITPASGKMTVARRQERYVSSRS
jgi:hypothetical protein